MANATTTTAVTDTTGAAPWSVAVITTDNTDGLPIQGNYVLRSGLGIEQLNFGNTTLGQQPVLSSVLYLNTGYTVVDYYGFNSNPSLPGYSFSQYTYAPGGAVLSTEGIIAGKLYVNNNP